MRRRRSIGSSCGKGCIITEENMKKREDEEVESAGLAGLVLDLQPKLLDSVAERNALAAAEEVKWAGNYAVAPVSYLE